VWYRPHFLINDIWMASLLCKLVRCFILKKQKIEMGTNTPTYYNYLSLFMALNCRRTMKTICRNWKKNHSGKSPLIQIKVYLFKIYGRDDSHENKHKIIIWITLISQDINSTRYREIFYPNPDIKYRVSNTKHMSFRL
jgi:hypothetical protein